MGQQAGDLWEERALPILRYIGAHETDMGFISIGDISKATGIEGHAVVIELERLIEAGYIPPELTKTFTGGDPSSWFLTNPRLTERGARAVSLWPRAEQLLETIILRMTNLRTPVAVAGSGRVRRPPADDRHPLRCNRRLPMPSR